MSVQAVRPTGTRQGIRTSLLMSVIRWFSDRVFSSQSVLGRGRVTRGDDDHHPREDNADPLAI